METRVVSVPTRGPLGRFSDDAGAGKGGLARLDEWCISRDDNNAAALAALEPAAAYLRASDTPVAFPTETVYGLGADATRSASVRGIYAAKGRPSDNPLIVHVADLQMLRALLRHGDSRGGRGGERGSEDDDDNDVIPARYKPLLERFWPGPLTILLPNPTPSPLAPEVTAGLPTFGVRMPSSPLALTLIKLAGVPLAAPSANASTKPSPTAARHVLDDLDGRIELILDGGACDVGVESTVVDGLCDPPVVLRPGGVGMDELRGCPGWEGVVKAYKDQSEEGSNNSNNRGAAPRAPGMKYKHYSPKARVVLYEASCGQAGDGVLAADAEDAAASLPTLNGDANQTNGHHHYSSRTVGVIRTKRWKSAAGIRCDDLRLEEPQAGAGAQPESETPYSVYAGGLKDARDNVVGRVFDISLGIDTRKIAHGLFWALRELDRRGADTIFVDGIDDELDIAAAVMNRLRKAASETRA
ncbi:L-threonylcarbamoyladenylate synthase [Purpureocillium takamizusanense]|uniref:Threonylcarbamoyl-AMP synthase n=1 Tax=Purpureocillium takamizusanense TaxID=2060973 RepID=A0A9Q8Q6S0_9HYPO|nr:L-threonylcarbamoyladenylate synthase [Purpureocillium takamizusanense]UNI14859.1 L-threonylcarbamoyladenylate synthase [Purpureocillium takamizusanense]